MLSPKRVKHRKVQRGRVHGNAHVGDTIAFGEFGLVCMEPEWLTNRQIEAGASRSTAYQARREAVDPHIPGQALHQEAGRDSHGQGQGQSRVLGRPL